MVSRHNAPHCGAFFVCNSGNHEIFAQQSKKMERDGMEKEESGIAERLEAATNLLERTLGWLEERQGVLTGEVERISATVEQSRRETELAEKLAAAERELSELKAGAAQNVLNPLRRTLPSTTSEMLSKHGIGDGPVDVRTLDAALSGLSLEQRIAVKTQLLRAGAIA
jgi:septal ring factor EnvC (AmiA/AmiB activator)